ncbi:hypothetical protein FGG08_001872 [Glutinoglossum americanum]|uniref:G-patch domain-containing protein n=1 Tax=Glutinoglossum americanum TaxID=1670608 RepID=A0A9P8L4Y4_9PEZI|nr:hypothetical protein FGG08_001872 [Glutinoglossum americanum]
MPSNSESQAPPRPAGGGMVSLYANLLDPSTASSTPASISRAPVVFQPASSENVQQDEASAKKQQISAAALRFQPTKRPQISSQKPKPKPSAPKPALAVANASATGAAAASPSATVSAPVRPVLTSSLADWAGNDEDDVNGFYGAEKRQRGGRKKRKKNRRESAIPQNWDDIYDPSRPNNYEEYKNSDERIREARDWKDRLYAHRRTRRASSSTDSEDDIHSNPLLSREFAPPKGYSFAPPEKFDDGQSSDGSLEPPPNLVDDLRGEDAYARRSRLTQASRQAQEHKRLPDSPNHAHTDYSSSITVDQPLAATISRAPVRYNLPSAPPELPSSEAELEEALRQEQSDGDDQANEDAPRSLRPGQKGFAERLMSKYGWTKGTGLGASGSGIINPLRVQVDKQKKKPDSEGGGFLGPGGRGKIIGGRKGGDGNRNQDGKFGAMSEVIILRGMVDGMDLDQEMEGPIEGGLVQEIGDECSEKYGRVERVFIDRNVSGEGSRVFVKFTSQLSALRAVNALEGRIFNGNRISARFFDTEKFESGIFE